MKIKLIGESKTIMENPNSIFNYFAWPTVARLQNNKIAVGASGYRMAHICPFGKAVISYSEDEGETYTKPAPIIDTSLDDRDAGICTFGEKGVIFTSFNNSVAQQRDWNCEGWSGTKEEVLLRSAYLDLVPAKAEEQFLGSTFTLSNDCGTTFGDIYISPVTSPHGPCELKDGTILWVGAAFNYQDAKNKIQAFKINLDGTNEKLGEIENIEIDGVSVESHEPHAIQLDDGTIICHIRVQKYGNDHPSKDIFTIYQSESNDGGKTWTKPHMIIDKQGGAPPHLLQLEDGTVICVYAKRHPPIGIKAMISRDKCKTWETGFEIYRNDLSWDIGYPATVELKNDTLLTVFYAHEGENTPAVIMQQKWKIED